MDRLPVREAGDEDPIAIWVVGGLLYAEAPIGFM